MALCGLRRSFVLVVLAAALVWASDDDRTALDRYVQAPDDSFHYELAGTIRNAGVTTYVLDMVSQNWLTADDVDRTEWRHWLTIIVPDRVNTTTALLFIDGGSNGEPAPAPDPLFLMMAAQTNAVVVDLRMIPNQPLRFAGDSRARSEDALIAYTWSQFLTTGDERWPARLPMTKSVVRAMDAVTAFCANAQGGSLTIDHFIVFGGSKRGWTTWTTAAVDPRVIAIAPLAIDILNVEASFIHHWRCYGFWAPAVQDYVDAGIMDWLGTPEIAALMHIEDPYQYRARLTMPKYIVNSTGDQFFLPDSSQFYFADLSGENYLRYVPNTDHSLQSLQLAMDLLAWFQSILAGAPRPKFRWTADRGAGTISLETTDVPAQVRLWQATNPQARDFRLDTIGPAWKSSPVEGTNGVYTVCLPPPDQGWTAFFLELSYAVAARYPWTFTTEVVVVPDVYPFDPPGN